VPGLIDRKARDLTTQRPIPRLATGRRGREPTSRASDKLCDLLNKYELGVTTTVRQVEDVTVDAGFFADI
jgi:hypothetical protein